MWFKKKTYKTEHQEMHECIDSLVKDLSTPFAIAIIGDKEHEDIKELMSMRHIWGEDKAATRRVVASLHTLYMAKMRA